MGSRPLKKKESILNPSEIYCLCCGEKNDSDTYYKSDSLQYRAYGRIPYCKDCIHTMYQNFVDEFRKKDYTAPERRAIQRLCMMLDLYYADKVFDSAEKEYNKVLDKSIGSDIRFVYYFIKHSKMYQYRTNDYNTTIDEGMKELSSSFAVMSVNDADEQEDVIEAKKIFGEGFTDKDYLWLWKEYQDWISRHECQTKSQEENFKAICHNRLNAYKANLRGDSTKDLDKTFNDLLNTGNLQPKQNKAETVSDTYTFGTLIEKWEDTAPIPEVDEELRDVDKLGLFLDVFFRGHLAKFMGLKNGVSKYYDEYMKQFTITKPSKRGGTDDDNSVDDTEVIFDTLFGKSTSDKED